ncbi:DUF1801 domain-containing protein [Pedobacter aquatilis]|uniref:DUF1801 domain-containing protein n=1 Tax=Pedobacter aquatilis TaxID=351343 RepID=UPI0025B2F5E7|nr:DUF1801 domain-containing protein [Pedobacter aquatilis]MDN3586309.1 DUF1801 domain-containing protein [Pedobacter aquatilis]
MEQSFNSIRSEQVSAYVKTLEAQLAEVTEAIRSIMLSIDDDISEHIKWNSPSFYYTGKMKDFDAKEYKRDIAVLNLNRNRIMLVLPTGARITEGLDILEGKYADGRRLIIFKDLDDVLAKAEKIKLIVKNWLQGIEKH